MIEKTLCLLKPDAVKRNLVGSILRYFEQRGLKLVALKMLVPQLSQIEQHYASIRRRHGEVIYQGLVQFLQEAPVVAFILQGASAVSVVRKICGETEPSSAALGSIRGDLAHQSFAIANAQQAAVRNLIHASSSSEEAVQEISIWFGVDEILNYKTTDQEEHSFLYE